MKNIADGWVELEDEEGEEEEEEEEGVESDGEGPREIYIYIPNDFCTTKVLSYFFEATYWYFADS